MKEQRYNTRVGANKLGMHERVFVLTTPLYVYCFSYLMFVVNWSEKAKRRRTTGTGRMRYLKTVHRRFLNGFQEGTQPISKKKRVARKLAMRKAKAKPAAAST